MTMPIKTINMLILFSVALLCTVFVTAKLDHDKSDRLTAKICEQYKVVPEDHLNRVPDGCVVEYFKNREASHAN